VRWVARHTHGVALGAALLLATLLTPALAAPAGGPAPPQVAAAAANGFAMMHGDPASSDTTPASGPGPGRVRVTPVVLGAACASVMVGSDGYPLATCTEITTREPTVVLISPTSGLPLASLSLPAGPSVLGGVYDYLDNHDRVVIVSGTNDLLRIAHERTEAGWKLVVASSVSLTAPVIRECGSARCDVVVGLTPDASGLVWFATLHGLVGTVDPRTGGVQTVALPAGELIANSISTELGYTAVATDHALYLFRAGRKAVPQELFREPYDRGGPRKPGQLSDGTGATPVFFGPHAAAGYVSITDNARPHEHLLVWAVPPGRTEPFEPTLVCDVPVLTQLTNSGTEDAPIAYDRTVIVTDTYGYPYPSGTVGRASPTSAPFVGGLTRVDLWTTGRGCRTVWNSSARSSALPRLSLADDMIQTVVATRLETAETSVYGDAAYYAVIDAATGRIVQRTYLGSGPTFDMLQLVGTTTPAGVMYQGTLGGYVRIAPDVSG